MEYNQPKKVSAIVSCYKGQKYLPAFLANAAEQTIADRTEIVLVHNEPSEEERRIVREFQNSHPGLVRHIIVPRENVAASTNRAMKAAAGEYLCIWNVDDLRTKDSLERMAQTLDANPDIGFTYGDFIIVNKWLATKGQLITAPEFKKLAFIQSMHAGPFYMWRKKLCGVVGFWDEQCMQAGDYDHAVRLALGSEGKKTHGCLGYYLNEGLGVSTRAGTLQPLESAFVELRYGVYHKLNFWYYWKAKKYDFNRVLTQGKWFALDELVPNRQKYFESRWSLIYALARYPFWFLKRIISFFKKSYAK